MKLYQSLDCLFVLMTVFFALQKLLRFRRSHLFNVALIVCATGVLRRKWSYVPMYFSPLPTSWKFTHTLWTSFLHSCSFLFLIFKGVQLSKLVVLNTLSSSVDRGKEQETVKEKNHGNCPREPDPDLYHLHPFLEQSQQPHSREFMEWN